MKPSRYLPVVLSVTLSVMLAQAPQDEHSQHHEEKTPPAAAPVQEDATPSVPTPRAAPGMEQMLQRMGAPAPKELYPSLMEFPDLPAGKRAELQRQAHDRMTEGVKLMGEGLRRMNEAAPRNDYASMQEASSLLRQGLTQFDSGLATHRALAEGKSPRNAALEWFRREMNLLAPVETETPHGFFGLSWFHYFVMFILLAFSAAMILMYYHKMRRADALLVSLAAGAEETAMIAAPTKAATAPSHTMGTAPAVSAPEVITPILTPPAGRWSGQLRVTKIFQETPDVRTFRLVHPSDGNLPFTFEPGQFLAVSASIAGKELKRSYSIASSACRRTWCEITVKRSATGQVSSYLHEQIRAGDLLALSGPFGKFTFRGHEANSVVLIAGGVGITPLMSAVRCLADQAWTGEVFLVYSCATAGDVIFREELQYLERRYANFRIVITLTKDPSPGWMGARGHITKQMLLETVPSLNTRRIHICGPPAMMDAVKTILADLGVPSEQIKTENFLGAEPRPTPTGVIPPAAEAVQAAAICRFVRSGKSAPLLADRTVLDVSEDVGVNIEYSCRQGYCGVCKTKLLAGRVTMAVEEGLTAEEKAANMILACQAQADENVEVDA